MPLIKAVSSVVFSDKVIPLHVLIMKFYSLFQFRKKIQCIGLVKQLQDVDFGVPLLCMVIAGETHPLEQEIVELSPA